MNTAGVLPIVLAGGRGTRLHPLTLSQVKPLIPFGGISRIVDLTLSNCVNTGFSKLVLLTDRNTDAVSRHIDRVWGPFRSNEIEIYVDPPPHGSQGAADKGTAGTVYASMAVIEHENPDYVLILASDHVYRMDYSSIINFHRMRKAELTIAAVEVSIQEAGSYGIIETDRRDRIIGFEEKPLFPKPSAGGRETALASMGVYVFNRRTLAGVLEDDGADSSSTHDFGRDIIPRLIGKKHLCAYMFRDAAGTKAGYWRDVGTLDCYFVASMDLLGTHPRFDLFAPDWPAYRQREYSFFAPLVRLRRSGRLGTGQVTESIISQDCTLCGGAVHRSILSPHVYIDGDCSVSESILFEGAMVGRQARIRRVVVGAGVDIPDGMEIGFGAEEDLERFVVSPGGVVVVAQGAVLPAHPRPEARPGPSPPPFADLTPARGPAQIGTQ